MVPRDKRRRLFLGRRHVISLSRLGASAVLSLLLVTSGQIAGAASPRAIPERSDLSDSADSTPGQVGGRIFGTGEKVKVKVLESESDFTSEIWLFAPNRKLIATDEDAGVVASIGRIAPAVELVFGIKVLDTGDTFYTGPAERNPDGRAHALVSDNGDGSYNVKVGFEDLPDESDDDFNDVLFKVSGVAQLKVKLDVRPRSKANRVNTQSRGALPIAILGKPGMKARAVDVESLCFGSVRRPGSGDCTVRHGRGRLADVNGDHRDDLVVRFDIQETQIQPCDRKACIVGRLKDGSRIVGCDTVQAR